MTPDPHQKRFAEDLAMQIPGRREQLRRRWRQRMQRLIFDITQFGRNDAESGTWPPADRTIFEACKPEVRRKFEERITKLAKEFTP